MNSFYSLNSINFNLNIFSSQDSNNQNKSQNIIKLENSAKLLNQSLNKVEENSKRREINFQKVSSESNSAFVRTSFFWAQGE